MWKWLISTTFVTTLTIGVGLLGNGFMMGMIGFWPTLIAVSFAWVYLLITALYFLEALIARPLGANVFSLSRHYFGPISAWIVSIAWMILLYGSMINFFSLTPPLITSMLGHYGAEITSDWIAIMLCLLIGGILCTRTYTVMVVNAVLGLIIGVIVFQSYRLGFAHFSGQFFKVSKMEFLIVGFPVVITSMYYHVLLPSLASFLNHEIKKIRSCIVIGSLIGAIIFTLWCIAISSAADQFEPENLAKLRFQFLNYEFLLQVPIIGAWMPSLSLVCIQSTTLIIGLATVDFLGDFFGCSYAERKGYKKLGLVALTLIPAYLLGWFPVRYFFTPILYLTDFSGLFVTGLLPILWVWSLRRFSTEHPTYTVPGGNKTLALMTLISCFIFYLLGVQIAYQSSN